MSGNWKVRGPRTKSASDSVVVHGIVTLISPLSSSLVSIGVVSATATAATAVRIGINIGVGNIGGGVGVGVVIGTTISGAGVWVRGNVLVSKNSIVLPEI